MQTPDRAWLLDGLVGELWKPDVPPCDYLRYYCEQVAEIVNFLFQLHQLRDFEALQPYFALIMQNFGLSATNYGFKQSFPSKVFLLLIRHWLASFRIERDYLADVGQVADVGKALDQGQLGHPIDLSGDRTILPCILRLVYYFSFPSTLLNLIYTNPMNNIILNYLSRWGFGVLGFWGFG